VIALEPCRERPDGMVLGSLGAQTVKDVRGSHHRVVGMK
jgi:hypothetical protein